MRNEAGASVDAGMGPGMGGGRGRGGFSWRNVRTFTSFRNPVYRIFYGGMLGDMLSQNMQMMARSLLVYRITGSASILGTMALAYALPMLFLSLYGGVIADRVHKKYVLLVGQISSAVISLGIALSLSFGYLSEAREGSWWILFVAGVFQGVVFGLMMPSRQAIIREIVSAEDLMNAVSLNVMGMNSLRILSPALAGFLIEEFNFEAVYYAMTGIYFFAIACVIMLPRTATIIASGHSAITEMKEGFRYVRHQTGILIVLFFTLIGVVLSMPYIILLPVFTEDILKVGASGLGWLMSISGVGAIIGSLILASLPNKKRGLMLLVSSLIMAVALSFFAFSSSWHLSLTLLVIVGFGSAGQMTLSSTLLQYYSEDEYRGRVMSILMMQFGLMSLGAFGAGVLAESIGVQWSVGGFALSLIAITALMTAFAPRLRRMD